MGKGCDIWVSSVADALDKANNIDQVLYSSGRLGSDKIHQDFFSGVPVDVTDIPNLFNLSAYPSDGARGA